MGFLINILKWGYRRLPRFLRLPVRRFYFGLRAVAEEISFSSGQAALDALIARRRCTLQPDSGAANIDVDICLVTYNSQRWLDGFFASLRQMDYPLSRLHLHVVDNGSQDGTLSRLLTWKQQLDGLCASFHILSQENMGFGAGQNTAIRNGRSVFVLIVNPDLEFEPASLRRCVARALADPIETASWEFRQKPYEHPKHYDPVSLETNWSAHACVLIRRSAVERTGGYDPNIFLYGEDVELSYRLRAMGYVLRYCPDAVVWHYSYASPGEVKPAQHIGSIAANGYLRWRYGSLLDRLAGALALSILMTKTPAFAGARSQIIHETARMVRLATSSPPIQQAPSQVHFGFRGFDYELSRQGAFYSATSTPLETPLVTIITRTEGKRPELLRQAACSIANQTYPAIEWIVVQDGLSPTPTSALIDQLSTTLPFRIRFIRQDKLGRSHAGNAGLLAATGQQIMFLDDDDLLYADHVETLVAALASNPDAAAAYSLSWQVPTRFNEDGLPIGERFILNPIFQQAFDFDVLLHHNYMPIQSLMFRRELFDTRGGFDICLDQLEDWNLWLRYAHGNRFVYVPKTTSLFRTPSNRRAADVRQAHMDRATRFARESALLRIKSK